MSVSHYKGANSLHWEHLETILVLTQVFKLNNEVTGNPSFSLHENESNTLCSWTVEQWKQLNHPVW